MVPKQLHREGYSRLYWGSSVVQGALRKPTQLEENNFFLQQKPQQMEAMFFFQEKNKITGRDDKHMHIESTLVFMSSSNRSIFVGFFSFLWQFLFHHPGICVDFGSSVHLQKSQGAHPSPQRVPNPKTQRTFG